MATKLIKTGDRLALVLDEGLLERTGITPDTPLDVSTDGKVIIISPARDEQRAAQLKQVVEDAHERYGGVFKRLAE